MFQSHHLDNCPEVYQAAKIQFLFLYDLCPDCVALLTFFGGGEGGGGSST